jgi:hypothetical protein
MYMSSAKTMTTIGMVGGTLDPRRN